ncbi:MAG: hypothetical protein DHS20C20_21300 [Ardenticatenaceae bacterium]|nr:MAG: hypothetical protein DHS20C20_21300 [Ardenticatenaceae bacterium]
MTDFPTITSLPFVFTLDKNGRSQLTVGVALSDGQRFWADCVDVPAASRMDETAVFDPIQAANHIQHLIEPVWLGQTVAEFRPLAQKLLPLTETFTYTKVPPPHPEPATGAVSRRQLISGFLADDAPTLLQKESVKVKRPLHPAMQYGLTAALLPAVAAANRVSVTKLVAQEYGVELEETAVPLQMPLNDQNVQAAQTILTAHVASVGYTTGKENHKAILGENGERLQQHVRQIAAWLPSLDPSFQPTIHLDLRGGLGELFENNGGKVLGAIYGLEQATKPYTLLIQNPIWHHDLVAQIIYSKDLTSYLRIRRMNTKLVADAWVDSLETAEQFSDPKICHMIHLELPRLGNLDVGITAVLHAHTQNHPVILSGTPTPLTTQIAIAIRPTQLQGNPLVHFNEMQKTLSQ